MDRKQILAYFSNLSDSDQQALLADLNRLFIKTLESSLSLVKSSNEIGVSEPTVFSWRHKFLSSQEPDSNEKQQKAFKEITEK
ncbi:MAG: hypothetical protein ACK5H1_01125 [Tenacibaculum sp.]